MIRHELEMSGKSKLSDFNFDSQFIDSFDQIFVIRLLNLIELKQYFLFHFSLDNAQDCFDDNFIDKISESNEMIN